MTDSPQKTWTEVQRDFERDFSEQAKRGQVSELTRLEVLAVTLFAQWIESRYEGPIAKSTD